ncbi:MAG: TlpA family protein disulfide reductase [Deltaproteobacteria bacterium]|nr:TlpA family protein disulfide reductase [Deltaproteobacteria bacterium]
MRGLPLAISAVLSMSIGCGGAPRDFQPQRVANREVSELTIFDDEGNDQALADHLGSPLVLHVFASWCAACRVELPALMQLETDTHIPVVALSIDPTFGRVRALFGGRAPPNVFRVDEQDVRRELGVSSLPQTFLVDARGRVRVRFAGARDWSDDDLRDLVRRELGLEE